MCSPVNSMLVKSASSWTAAPSGVSNFCAQPVYAGASGPRPSDPLGLRGLKPRGADLRALEARGLAARGLRLEQRIQDQGRSVVEHLFEDMTVQAPATAHVGVTANGDVSGPHPWRPPV